ncbi:MAG: 1-acyl-sn-glycerol-3-phosphate acyltransferase [Spirochaetales bacterium]|nr:1-acyl-sn-glycerol-3-phosphate acyltransferase [Spirochaetales bacterium]
MNHDFEKIRAYKDEDIPVVMDRLLKSRWFIRNCRMLLFPGLPGWLNKPFDGGMKLFLTWRLKPIKTTLELHRKIIIDKVVSKVIFKTSDGISFSGLEKLDRSKPYLFVSNHRDIALDPLLLNYILCTNNFHPAEIGFGNNLMFNEPLTDLIRIYGSYIIQRDLPKREKIQAVANLSAYIRFRLSQGHSIWIAQRKGRAKDGFDKTNPSVLKMLSYSARKEGMSFRAFLDSVNLIPVSISYELDPLDRLKAWEVFEIQNRGCHRKWKMEDMTSVIYGMRGDKGRINCSFGERIKGYETPAEAAQAIDNEIYRTYRLWPTNYIAFDVLDKGNRYADRYSSWEKVFFLRRFRKMKKEVRTIAMQTYANPVMNQTSTIQPSGASTSPS